jgi:hypothetical protein
VQGPLFLPLQIKHLPNPPIVFAAAVGERQEALKDTKGNECHLHRGTHWHRQIDTQHCPFGFLPESSVDLSGGADTTAGPQKLPWCCVKFGGHRAGGIIGIETEKATSKTWGKLIFWSLKLIDWRRCKLAVVSNRPSSTATMAGLGPSDQNRAQAIARRG